MRAGLLLIVLALALALAGCAPFNEAAGALAGVETVVAIPVFGRTTGDLLYSALAGRDCSIVHLEQGGPYCRPREGPPEPPPFCTRTLGLPECWAAPASLPGRPTPLADAPAPTPEQEAHRTARWPDL